MLRAIGFVPMAPILRPEVAGSAASELDELRESIATTIAALADQGASLVVLTPESGLDIAHWLLDFTQPPAAHHLVVVPDEPTTPTTIKYRQQLKGAACNDDIAVLVLGDGSACRSVKAPGYLDDRATPFDNMLAAALRTGNASALADLDVAIARELLAAGRATWPIVGQIARGQRWHAELIDFQDPYGVAYFVALWLPERVGMEGIGSVTC